jgi:hypothetical protein
MGRARDVNHGVFSHLFYQDLIPAMLRFKSKFSKDNPSCQRFFMIHIIRGGNLDEARRMNARLCLFNIMPFASDSEKNKKKKTAS